MLPPNASVLTPVAVIRTTAGLTFAAALTTDEESSTTTGLELGLTTAALGPAPGEPSRAPVPWRTSTVPPEARMAESIAAATTGPMPVAFFAERAAGACGEATGGAVTPAPGSPDGCPGAAQPGRSTGWVGAGSTDSTSSHGERAHSGRRSGVGE